MLTFTTQPAGCIAAEREAKYRIASDRPTTIDIRVTDTESGEILGTKRFADVTEATCDIAPIVRRHIRFTPRTYATGLAFPKDRRRIIKVTATPAEAPANEIVSETSICHAGAEDEMFPWLLTTMPRQRLIGPREHDEILLTSIGRPRVTVTATGPDGAETRTYTAATLTLHQFHLDMSEFPGAEYLKVDAGNGVEVDYTVTPTPQGARRIAWRSTAGSLEHYTFPTELTAGTTAAKTRIYGADGPRTLTTGTTRRMRLRSAYETREMLERLAGIIASPEVWMMDEEEYIPVEVVTETAVVHRHGVLSSLEIEIGL